MISHLITQGAGAVPPEVSSWLPWAVSLAVGGLGMVAGPSPGEAEMSDQDMVRAVLAGDAHAYRGLVEKYQQRVYHVVFGMVRNREDARDLTQEAFIKAFRNLEGFRQDSRFYTWLYRIAMNVTIDFTRRRARAPVGAGAEEDVAVRDADRGIADARRDDSPRKQLERKELHGAILEAIGQLPEGHRQAILLREVEGLSYKEIADVLEIKEGTVMSRLFYARRKLQEMLVEFSDEM